MKTNEQHAAELASRFSDDYEATNPPGGLRDSVLKLLNQAELRGQHQALDKVKLEVWFCPPTKGLSRRARGICEVRLAVQKLINDLPALEQD